MSLRSAAREWTRESLRYLAERAAAQARAGIPSKTLRDALKITYPAPGEARLHIPHYWAEYVHDGTGPVRDTLMVWYRDPKNDPRIRGGYPVRRRDVRRLTAAQFKRDRKAGLLIVAFNRRAVPGRPFFDNDGNMAPFLRVVKSYVPFQFRRFVRTNLADVGVGKPIRI